MEWRKTLRHRVLVPYVATPHKRRREIHLPVGASSYVRPIGHSEQYRLFALIARAKAWLRELIVGASVQSIADREDRSERAVRLTLSLAFLDPKLVTAALRGFMPKGVSARRLLEAPADWHEQWRGIGLARPGTEVDVPDHGSRLVADR